MDVVFAIVQIWLLDGTHPIAMQTEEELFPTRSECEEAILHYTKYLGGSIEFKKYVEETIMFRMRKDHLGNTKSADICVKLINQN